MRWYLYLDLVSHQIQKPGDGTPGSGTVRDLQSWGFTLGNYMQDLGQGYGGSFSPDGVSWHHFDPGSKQWTASRADPKPALMFEQGTVEIRKVVYKLFVTRSFSTDDNVKAELNPANLLRKRYDHHQRHRLPAISFILPFL